MDKILYKLYYTPNKPSAFSSLEKLYNAAKKEIPKITYSQVKNWLSAQLTYTLHKQARNNFSRNKILVSYENEQFQADLVDMALFSRSNRGYSYILTAIDCFSKYAFAIPLKSKTADSVLNGIKEILRQQKPHKLQTDNGKEFINNKVQTYLRKENVHFFTTKNTTFKCAMVERFNRTLKAKMFKLFTKNGNRNYIDYLNDLIHSYNNTVHSTTKLKPVDVTKQNENLVFRNIYNVNSVREFLLSKKVKPKLKIGDKVRQKYELPIIRKGYYPLWSDNTYTITKLFKGDKKPMYKIKDGLNTELPQRFYPEQVQKITENKYRIEKLIRRVKQNGVTGYIVKWLNYDNRYNSFVPMSDIESI